MVSVKRGDYIFYAWIDNEDKRYNKTIKTLKQNGYKLVDVEYGYQEKYEYFKNDSGDSKVVTQCLV